MNKNYFIFDVDGTLVDTKFQNIQSFKKVLVEKLNMNIGEEGFQMAAGLPGKETLRRLKVQNVDEVYDDWTNEMIKLDYTVKLYDGVMDLLLFLKKRKSKLGIVTSRTRSEIDNDKVLGRIIDFFDVVVGFSDELKPKPNPDQLLKAIKYLNAVKKNTLYIGDTLYDYQCAKNAGVEFCLACWGYEDYENEILSKIPKVRSYKSPYEIIKQLQAEK